MADPIAPPARLGLQLAIGALVLIAAAWLFGAIAEDVVTGDRHHRRRRGARATGCTRHATPASRAGCSSITQPAFDGRGLELRRARRLIRVPRRTGGAWRSSFVCVAGGLTLNVAHEARLPPRPAGLDDPLLTLSSYSFPSGHVAGSTIFYGLGLLPHVRARARCAGAAALAVAPARSRWSRWWRFTRMYLGVHYLSDVGAAFAEGVAWLAICLDGGWRRLHRAPQATRAGQAT